LSASLQDIFSVDHTVSGRAKRTGSSTHRLLTPANIARCGGLPPPAHSAHQRHAEGRKPSGARTSLYFVSRSTLRLMLPLLVVHDFNVADQIADDFYTIEICSRDLRGGEEIL
jgi:hypothetical protein